MADNKQGKATTPAASEGKRATASVTSAATPKPTGELSDKDLDGVAGGFSGGMEGGMMAGWRISLGLTLYVMRRDKIGPFANDR